LTYLLDSNVCIRLINNSSPAVTNRLASQQPEDILISTITQLELYYGAYRSVQKERNLEILQLFFSQFIIYF
jgi:tRNA(fMet)-specific endonuclease VapC